MGNSKMKMDSYAFRLRITFTLLAFAAAAGCTPEPPQTSQVDVAAVREEVLELENAANLAVDAGQCEFPGLGDREPIFVSGGRVVRTGSELLEMCEEMVAPRTGAVFAPDRITANVLSNDVAYVVREGNYTINYKDGTSRTVYLVMTTVFHRQDEGWKMVHLHESSRRP